jgi:hypothetical protein
VALRIGREASATAPARGGCDPGRLRDRQVPNVQFESVQRLFVTALSEDFSLPVDALAGSREGALPVGNVTAGRWEMHGSDRRPRRGRGVRSSWQLCP